MWSVSRLIGINESHTQFFYTKASKAEGEEESSTGIQEKKNRKRGKL